MKKSEFRQLIREEIRKVLSEDANTNLELKNIAKNLYSGLKQKGLRVFLDYTNVKDGQWSATLQTQGSGAWVSKAGQPMQVKGNPVPGNDDARILFDDKTGNLNIYFRALKSKDEVAFVKNVLTFVKGVVDKNYKDKIEIVHWDKTSDLIKQMETNVEKGPVGTSGAMMMLRPPMTGKDSASVANRKGAVQGATKYKGLEVAPNKDGSTSIYAPGGLWGGQGSKTVAITRGKRLVAQMYDLKQSGIKPEILSKIETILQSYAKENNLQYDNKSAA